MWAREAAMGAEKTAGETCGGPGATRVEPAPDVGSDCRRLGALASRRPSRTRESIRRLPTSAASPRGTAAQTSRDMPRGH